MSNAYYLEFDDARSGGSRAVGLCGGEKKVVLGLVTTKRPELESKDAVIARIHEAAKYLPLDRLCLSPQCGFASCEIGNKLTEAQQWAKLALVKGDRRGGLGLSKIPLGRPRGQMSESMLTAAFIILSGGLQDAYTYLCRGKVFANAQTGNIVLFSAYLFDGDWAHSRRYLVPVLSFMLVFSWLSVFIGISSTRRGYTGGSSFFWRRSCCCSCRLSAAGGQHGCQRARFVRLRHAGADLPQGARPAYASTMCIGNMRSGTRRRCAFTSTRATARCAKRWPYFA